MSSIQTYAGATIEEEREAVRKGADLLDTILPGWHNAVTFAKLNMASGSLCMLGQLFGNDVEAALAKTMYPDEMAIAASTVTKEYSRPMENHGHAKATGLSSAIIPKVLERKGLRTHDLAYDKYSKLLRACYGHDNRCLWAEAIAERKAQDALSSTNTPATT